jgi:hypothetical protein
MTEEKSQMYEGKGVSMHPSGLNIIENDDGSFALEWDKNDPRWSFLNGLTDAEIQVIMEDAIKNHLADLETKND